MEENRRVSIAFLIVAHTKPEQLNLFIKQLLAYDESYVYIHIDAKNQAMIADITKNERVEVLPNHINIRWGDYSQIEANNYLIDYARKKRHHDFYSLHSGMDLAIRTVEQYALFLKETDLYAYYICSKLPNHWQYGGGLARIALYWPRLFRNRLSKHSPVRYLRSLYGRLYGASIIKGKKLPDEYTLYGGADWFTIREDCVNDIFAFLSENEKFQNLFVHSLSGAEIYYVTIFETMKQKRTVCNRNSLRFVDHRTSNAKRNPGSPNICTMDYLPLLERTQSFFARKFDMDVDRKIVEYFVNKCVKG